MNEAATERTKSLDERIRGFGDWFHNIDLAGVYTAPDHFLGNYPQCKWARFADAIPRDLRGLTVLDIGCNAGFYSIEMKRRGAARVLAIDTDERYLAQGRFASEVLGLDIEFQQMSVYELGRLGEKFDLVLFMGVFYHLRHPLLALDLIHKHAARNLFVFQAMQRGSRSTMRVEEDYAFTEVDIFSRPEFPAMYFIEKQYCKDPTNWWVPNRSCAEALLRSSGFEIITHPEEEVYICRWVATDEHPLPNL